MDEIDHLTEPVIVADHDRGSASLNAAIAAAYDTYSSTMYGLALRATRDPEHAADVTQEAFLRLLTEGQRGRYPDNVGGWLYRTSSNLIISRARRATVARRLAPRLLAHDEPPEPDGIALGNEQQRELGAALATLSVDDRLALVMSAQGATGEEIAAFLGRSYGATRTLLTRARTRLRAAALRGEVTL